MRFQIRYRSLCTVNLWHDFALARGHTEFAGLAALLRDRILADYSIHDWLRIAATEETASLLSRYRLRLVPRPAGFVVAGAVRDSEAQPAGFVLERPLPADIVLRFTLEVIRPDFLQQINLPPNLSPLSLFLFSNQTGGSSAGELHLTRPLPAFDPGKAYLAGDLVVDQEPAPTIVLESVEDVSAAATPATGKWIELPAPRFDPARSYEAGELVCEGGSVFAAKAAGILSAPPAAGSWTRLYDAALRTGVSAADSVVCLSRESVFSLEAPLPFIKLTVRDRGGQVVLSETQRRQDGEPLREVRLSLATAAPGPHTLQNEAPDGSVVGTLPATFYLHPGAERGRPFGVIELVNPAGGLALFDGAGVLLTPDFHIRFRHRRAFWRYIFHGDVSTFPPADLGELVQENPADRTRYATSRPLPLTAGMVSLKNFDGKKLLTNPEPSSTRKEGGKLYAETFLAN